MTMWNAAGRSLAAGLALTWLGIGLLVALGPVGATNPVLLAVLALLPAAVCLYAAAGRPRRPISPVVALLAGVPALTLQLGLLASLAAPLLEGRPVDPLASAEMLYALVLAVALSCLHAGLLLGGPRQALRIAGTAAAVALLSWVAVDLLTPPAAAAPTGCRAFQPAPAVAFEIAARAEMDAMALATGRLEGSRGPDAEQWQAQRSGRLVPESTADFVRLGNDAQLRLDGGDWQSVEPRPAFGAADLLDGPLAGFLVESELAAAEDLGVEVIDGEATRRCRLMIEGRTAGRLAPLLGWLLEEPLLAGRTNLPIWRGELDWWVAPAHRLVRAEFYVGGHPHDAWRAFGLQGRLRADISVRELAGPPNIEQPLP